MTEIERLVGYVEQHQGKTRWVIVYIGPPPDFSSATVAQAKRDGRIIQRSFSTYNQGSTRDSDAAEAARAKGWTVKVHQGTHQFFQEGYELRTHYSRETPPDPEHAKLCDHNCPRRYSSDDTGSSSDVGHSDRCPMNPHRLRGEITPLEYPLIAKVLHRRFGYKMYAVFALVALCMYVVAHTHCSVSWR